MYYGLAADIVMSVHFLFVLFVVLGGIAVWRWPRVAWLHVPAFVWGMLISVYRWICPLTPLEQSLRRAAGEADFDGGFIAHYIEPLLYPEGLTYSQLLFFGGVVTALNAALYWHAWYRRKTT